MSRSVACLFAITSACSLALAAPPAKSAPGQPTLHTASIKVAMLFDAGGREDRGFNEAASRGLQRASAELGVQGWIADPVAEGKRRDALERAIAQHPDLIIGVGFLFSDDVLALAKQHPKQRFAVVDYVSSSKEAPPGNLLALSFAESEGAYLVGVLAALHSKTDKLGFLGGMDAPIIRRFWRGYEAGARSIKPGIEVRAVYADKTAAGFTSPGKGKALALELYGRGADVVFHASGATGFGVLEAAREKQQWVIGVDRYNWKDAPGLQPATMVKHIDQAVFEAIRTAKEGAWQGGLRAMDLKRGGVGIQYNELEPALVPPDMRAKVKQISDDLVSGKLRIAND